MSAFAILALQLVAGDLAYAPETPFAAAASADYVATYDDNDYAGRVRPVVITRHGAWLREDRRADNATGTIYSNLRSHTSISVSQSADGGRYLNVWRHGPPSYDHYSVEGTAERDRVVGERCTVLRVVRADGPGERGCRTRDGVDAWWRVYYRDGQLMQSRTLRWLVRRRVAEAEVWPAPNLFLWSSWATPESAGPNDEVLLCGDAMGGEPATLVIRRRGGGVFRDERSARSRTIQFDNGATVFLYSWQSSGETDLTLQRRAGQPQQALQAVDLHRREQVLGETCFWFDTRPGVQDAGASECRTRDGIVLKIVRTSRGGGATFVATHVQRGGVSAAAMTPPANLLNWPLDLGGGDQR